MPAAISINNDTLFKEELEELARKCQVTRIRKRLKAIALILKEKLSRLQVRRKLKVGMQTPCDWVNRYNTEGLWGLYDRPRIGRLSKLTEMQQQAVVGWVIEGTTDGEPGWTLESLQLKIKKVFGISFSHEGIRRLLIRHGLRYSTSRPHNSKADFEAQQQLRDAFSGSASKILPNGLAPEKVWIFFQDESGVGQRSVSSRIRAKKNTRPPMVQDQFYGNCYLFSSIFPDTGCLVYLVCDKANTEQITLHLQQISAGLPKGLHELDVLDKASWHKSNKLLVLDNVGLLRLVSYSPQLNSAENLS